MTLVYVLIKVKIYVNVLDENDLVYMHRVCYNICALHLSFSNGNDLAYTHWIGKGQLSIITTRNRNDLVYTH